MAGEGQSANRIPLTLFSKIRACFISLYFFLYSQQLLKQLRLASKTNVSSTCLILSTLFPCVSATHCLVLSASTRYAFRRRRLDSCSLLFDPIRPSTTTLGLLSSPLGSLSTPRPSSLLSPSPSNSLAWCWYRATIPCFTFFCSTMASILRHATLPY
jgi:hypothetical protein